MIVNKMQDTGCKMQDGGLKTPQSYEDTVIYGIAKELARKVYRMTLVELPKFGNV